MLVYYFVNYLSDTNLQQLPKIDILDDEGQNSEEIIDVEQETRIPSEALVEQAHSCNNSTSNSSFEDQVT